MATRQPMMNNTRMINEAIHKRRTQRADTATDCSFAP